jgi:hypothetical protein
MNITAKKIAVDAGMIMIADFGYLTKMECTPSDLSELERLGKTFKVPNSKYMVSWNIDDTYNGDIEGWNSIVVKSGKIVVVDPCYVFQNDNQERWMKWLEDTHYGDEINESAFCISEMGGDDLYTVKLLLDRTDD